MVNIYGGKGDAMTCGSYRGNKLLEPCTEGSEKRD